jgi:ankyrin repeat protein
LSKQVCAWLNNRGIASKLVANGALVDLKNSSGWTAMHICARQAHDSFLTYLVELNANVNQKNNSDKTPLLVSARHGHLTTTRILLDSKADTNAVNIYGQSALFVAVQKRHTNIVNMLIEYGAEVNQCDKQSNTPLHVAALSSTPDNLKIVDMLFKHGASSLTLNYLQMTPLHYAAKTNSVDLVRKILKNSNPKILNQQDIYGQTALYIACMSKSSLCINYLLEKKANKDIESSIGYSPLHALCTINQDDDQFDGTKPANRDAKTGQNLLTNTNTYQLVKVLLDHGDDVNKLTGNSCSDADNSDDMDTPLHIAIRHNNASIIQFLIDNKADLNKKNRFGYTPLHYACFYGNYGICSILLANGAKINKAAKDGSTPLHQTIHNSNSNKIASLLVDHGADINQEDMQNTTPLAMAIRNGNYSICNLLIGKKARILNANNETVLYTLALKNKADVNCLQILIDKYDFDKLLSHSITNLRNPLQLGVEKRSNEFLNTLFNCNNIICYQLLNKLHSKCAFGVSPIVMVFIEFFIHYLLRDQMLGNY